MNKPEVLYEDNHLIIVNKEVEELSVPGRGPEKQQCLMTRVAPFYREVFNVHRLDQPTSGLVIIALEKEMQRELSILFQKKQIKKEYIAIVEGAISKEEGIIDLAIRGDMDNRPVQIVDPVLGKEAVTRWSVLERGQNYTRLLLKPETGRTHQLRVHLKSIGHPIMGDRLYNNNCSDDVYGELKLHAALLDFIHPLSGKRIIVRKEPDF